jgi:hypothetical protein
MRLYKLFKKRCGQQAVPVEKPEPSGARETGWPPPPCICHCSRCRCRRRYTINDLSCVPFPGLRMRQSRAARHKYYGLSRYGSQELQEGLRNQHSHGGILQGDAHHHPGDLVLLRYCQGDYGVSSCQIRLRRTVQSSLSWSSCLGDYIQYLFYPPHRAVTQHDSGAKWVDLPSAFVDQVKHLGRDDAPSQSFSLTRYYVRWLLRSRFQNSLKA